MEGVKKLEELKKELKEDKFRSSRGKTNDCSLSRDCLMLFEEYAEVINSDPLKNNYYHHLTQEERDEMVGSGIFSILQYQILLLLERVQYLEECNTELDQRIDNITHRLYCLDEEQS